jgi:hypothetical protein
MLGSLALITGSRRDRAWWLICLLLSLTSFSTPAHVNVLTYHNDNARTGQNLDETTLTPFNVNTNSFGRLFYYNVDGNIYAQPLYVSNLEIPGKGVHNVVFVATEHNSVYAFDADDNSTSNAVPLWHVSFIKPSALITPVPGEDEFGVIQPEIGITGTPVIDLASRTIYVNVATKEIGNLQWDYFHRLHALDLGTGAEKFGGPVVVSATVRGTGKGNDGAGIISFEPYRQFQRPGLLLVNGVVYIAYASYADAGNYHGWVFGYDAQTLQLRGVFNDTPNGHKGGIWQSGAAPAADSSGNIYLLTGDGAFDYAQGNYGNSVLKLVMNGEGLQVADYFTPFNQLTLDISDTDLGSGGAVLLPDSVGTVTHQHLMVGSGKEGKIYLLDRDNLGQYNGANDNQIVQTLPSHVAPTFGLPAYFNNHLYYIGIGDVVKSFRITNAQIVEPSETSSLASFGYPGATPSVSANGTTNGIIWAIRTDMAQFGGRATLHAFDATDVSRELYNSSQAGTRDDPGGAIKFSVPTVANGKVYVGTASRLAVFGTGSWAPAPTLVPKSGIFTNSIMVSMSTGLPGTQIHYTLDGTAASLDSPLYTSPLQLTNSTVIRAIALRTNLHSSGEVTASFGLASSTATIVGFRGNGWTLNGGASAANDVLTLADGLGSEQRSAFFKTRQVITSFTARFIYRPSVRLSGAAFVLQNSINGPRALGGGRLGLGGLMPGAAIFFDLRSSGTSTGYATNGSVGISSSTLPLDLGRGNPIAVTLTYNGLVLTEHLLDLNTGTTFDAAYVVNLAAAVGNANTAFIGFTGASGSSAASQMIEGFTFDPYQPPILVIANPSDGAVFRAPKSVIIAVNASVPDSAIKKVEFFQNDMNLGEDGAGPYALSWMNPSAGRYTLTARATDDQGHTMLSSPVQITVTPPPLHTAQVAYYPLIKNANDFSGNGNHGAVIGYDWKFSRRLYLNTNSPPTNGVDNLGGSYVIVPRPASLDFNQNFTLSVWVKLPEGLGSHYDHNLIGNGADFESANFRIITDGNGGNGNDYLQYVHNYETGDVHSFISPLRNVWQHLVAVRSGSVVSLFRNGNLITNSVVTAVATNLPTIWIGRYSCTCPTTDCDRSYSLSGGIGNVRLYHRPFSTNEVFQLYLREKNQLR